ncbi:6-phosphogluconolactonase [Sphingomonas montanisoli]|uniref:6-phosphogluconolactonase n=1 Tax=Sphingomonas montanisoli TaxID=2606412 RepID=A0A5D9C6Q4_9SPHN|nr:6-phosphogluconolactonase [Sphingomonas montanisoli]TZG25691.1 6-phosphogluconolactonase [Sphingomonas montanisoli]
MTECLIEIVDHASPAAAARIVAEEAATWIAICAMNGTSSVVLPGGRSQIAMLTGLASYHLPWNRITITTTDERQVPFDHPLSNIGSLQRVFQGRCGSAAKFVALDRAEAASDIHLPFDLVILGMGADGHIASLFPGFPVDGDDPRHLIETMPDPVPINAPVARRSWNLTALTQTNRTLLVCAGKAKRAALERALTSSETSPLAAFLRRARGLVTVHWAEDQMR